MPGRVTARFEPASRAEWRCWLARNHRSQPGVWLILTRKAAGQQPVSLADAVEEALCFGWIDGGLRGLDDRRIMLRFTPRTRGSTWSAPNRRRVEHLIHQGLMTPAGRAVIEVAQRDGSWAMLDDVEELRIPDDLAAALAADPAAGRHFAGFSASARKQALWWIISARRPATRAARIQETVRLAAQGRTLAER